VVHPQAHRETIRALCTIKSFYDAIKIFLLTATDCRSDDAGQAILPCSQERKMSETIEAVIFWAVKVCFFIALIATMGTFILIG
jgi:hypothetical protein